VSNRGEENEKPWKMGWGFFPQKIGQRAKVGVPKGTLEDGKMMKRKFVGNPEKVQKKTPTAIEPKGRG